MGDAACRLAAAQLYGDPVKVSKSWPILLQMRWTPVSQHRLKMCLLGCGCKIKPGTQRSGLRAWAYQNRYCRIYLSRFIALKTSDVRGLGIGLAMAKQYVEQDFGGQIAVSSEKQRRDNF